MKKIGVIGIGNPLRKDDGVGIVLIERLQKIPFPDTVEFVDGGTGGMNLLHILARFDTVILLDAVDFHGNPGEFRFFTIKEIQSKKPPIILSTHDSNILNIIRLSKEMKELPKRLILFGVQPQDVSFGMGLTKKIEAALNDFLVPLQQKIQLLLR